MNSLNRDQMQVITHDREALANLTSELAYERDQRHRRLTNRWEILRAQHQHLDEMLHFVLTESLYYRRLADKVGFTPRDGLAAFHRFPLLTRDLYSMNLDKIRVSVRYTCYRDSTSGTSGTPIEVFRDTKSLFLESRRFADILKYYLADSAPLHSGGMAILYVSHYPTSNQHVYKDPVLGATVIKIRCDGSSLCQQLGRMGFELKNESYVLTGTVSSLLYLATCEHARSQLPMAALVLPSGEELPASARRTLEETFLAPVAELYTLREFGTIAFQCRRGSGLHVQADWFVMEVLDGDGRSVSDGELGNLVVTDLTNNHTPLLRYTTGDIGFLNCSKCICGLSLPLLTGLSGRKPVTFSAADGALIDTAVFAKLMEHLPITWYRVTQGAAGDVSVEYCSEAIDHSHRVGAFCTDLKLALGLANCVSFRSISMPEASEQGKSGGFVRLV